MTLKYLKAYLYGLELAKLELDLGLQTPCLLTFPLHQGKLPSEEGKEDRFKK